jgi:hypothetical protein
MDTLIELDSRRRATLGSLAHPDHRRYIGSVAEDGTITLTPAVVMTELEARFRANTELVDRVRHSIDHPEELVEVDWRVDA